MLPRCRNGHHNRKWKIHSAHHHKFQRIIKHGRIGTFLVYDWKDLMHVIPEILGLHILFPGHHLIHISANGIDLTIMNNKAVGMGSHPAGVCIGTEPGMNHCNGRFIILILEVRKKFPKFLHQKHTLIYNGSAA